MTILKLRAALILSAAITAALGAAACSPPADNTSAAAPAADAPAAHPDVHRFTVGALDLIALREGGMNVPNDNAVFGVGLTPAAVSEVLTAAGQPGDTLALSIQPLLVRTGDRLVLLDAGAGASMGAGAGKLPASLSAAGIQPSQITDVVISHSHPDHIAGLVGADGALTFPNARVHIAAAEWTFLKANPQLAALVTAIESKVVQIQPGAVIAPGVTTIAINGHTPGHIGVEVASNGEKLLYVADTVHNHIVSVQRPEWRTVFDNDTPTAQASRRAVLQRAVDENLLVYAVHFPFPGVGRVTKQGETFAWAPLTQ